MMGNRTGKLVSATTLGVVLIFASATPAVAQVRSDDVVASQVDDTPRDNDRQDDDGDNGLWGLLGLVGLLGLLGLVPRRSRREEMAGYPVGEPPMNAYPPANPTRNPPGTGR